MPPVAGPEPVRYFGGMPPPFSSPCWDRYRAEPHAAVPARELTWIQAAEVIAHAVLEGWLVLARQLQFGPNCEVILPASTDHRIDLASNVLAGVAVRERQSWRRPPSSRTTITNISPRLAVMTLRLARFLGAHWGATEIYHMGMGQGRGPAGDPHNSGRAMDFFGARTRAGEFFVDRDWGDRPVWINGRRVREWDPEETHTRFRLARDGRPLTPAGQFFLEVYKFFTTQASDGPTCRARCAHIGDRGYIIHPDYPIHGERPSQGRHAHQEHVHVEVPAVAPRPDPVRRRPR